MKPLYFSYISRLFLQRFFTISGGSLALVILFDIGELYRRHGDLMPWSRVWQKLPFLYHAFLPLFLMAASTFLGMRLMRSYEWIALRTAGLSFRRIFWPLGVWCSIISFVDIMWLHPFSLKCLPQKTSQTSDHQWITFDHQGKKFFFGAKKSPHTPYEALEGTWYEVHKKSYALVNQVDSPRWTWNLHGGHYRAHQARQYSPQVLTQWDQWSSPVPMPFWLWHKKDPERMNMWQLKKYMKFFQYQGIPSHRHMLQWHKLLSRWILMMCVSALAFRFWERGPRNQPLIRLLSTIFSVSWGVFFIKDLSFAVALSYGSTSLSVWVALMTTLGLSTFVTLKYTR